MSMKSVTAEASFWIAVALVAVVAVYAVRLLAASPLGERLPGFRGFGLSL